MAAQGREARWQSFGRRVVVNGAWRLVTSDRLAQT